jgi:hypothetical protein
VLLLLAATPAIGQSLEAENQRLRAELAEARARIAELEAELGQTQRQVETATRQRDRMTQLAGLTVEGDRLDSQEARIETTYDADTDRTTVRSDAERLTLTGGSKADTYFNAAFSYDGQTPPTEPRGVRVVLQTAMSDGDFRQADEVVFRLDGQELVVPIAEYRVNARSSRAGNQRRQGRGNEVILLDLSAEQLRRVASAVTAVGTIGDVGFVLTPDQIATLRAMELRQGG